MSTSEKADGKKHKDQVPKAGTSLTRRNFLRMCGAAVGSGALLGQHPL